MTLLIHCTTYPASGRLVDALAGDITLDERAHFIADHRRGLYTMTELCARNAISRKSATNGSPVLRRVGGDVPFQRRLLFIANALKQHRIGLEEVDDGVWSIDFHSVLLARRDERDYLIRD